MIDNVMLKEKAKNHNKIIRLSLFVIGSLVLFFGGWYLYPALHGSDTQKSIKVIRENSSDYGLINPLLLVLDGGSTKAPEYNKLTNTLNSYVKDKINNKKAESISIYFRDLNSGIWSGVDENHLYSPASMMKVALLISCLSFSYSNPDFLDKEVYVTPNSTGFDSGQSYKPKKAVVPGGTYKVRDLISFMVVDSDNNATAALEYILGEDKINNLLKELQLSQPKSMDSDFLSPRMYSRFYRILYNSTYLPQDVSENALKILSQDDFPDGIVAGVPKNITVAQKFGERTVSDTSGNLINRELHDCGIVYLPSKPYFLCVMTKGKNFNDLQPILSDVSKIVWDGLSDVK
ncbi:MAG: serine hydrolase [bacterium]